MEQRGPRRGFRGRRRVGFEFERTSAPRTTKSKHSAREPLGLEPLYVIQAGEETFRLCADVTAVPLRNVLRDRPPLDP